MYQAKLSTAPPTMLWSAGWDEIIRLKDQLEAPSSGFNRSRYSVLPLHSMVPAADQRKVFVRPQLGVRKVVSGHQHCRDGESHQSFL